MPSITLAYHDEDLSQDLSYATIIAEATAYKTFTPIELYDPEKEHIIHNPDITSRGKRIEHRLHSHYRYPLKIAPKELIADSTKLAFLRSLWDADYIYISYYNYNTLSWSNFVEVIRNGKQFPIEYLKGIKYLPYITFNFIDAKAV